MGYAVVLNLNESRLQVPQGCKFKSKERDKYFSKQSDIF